MSLPTAVMVSMYNVIVSQVFVKVCLYVLFYNLVKGTQVVYRSVTVNFVCLFVRF